jgi:putative MATE family efflux protein
MTPPMVLAFLAMMAFHLADTWFVSRLGTLPLAAMGFTFPVVMLMHALAMGLGLGTSACVSAAVGRKDPERMRILVTASLLLSFLIFLALSAGAWSALPRLFGMLGARGETLGLTIGYMRVWLLFAPLGVLPMIGNHALRATGDTLRPGLIMGFAAVINVLLDPLLIFGWGPVPAFGIAGAALATGISRMFTLAAALWLIHRRCRLLAPAAIGRNNLLHAWRRILHVAVPASATNMLMPLTVGIITRIIASFGEFAVAATAAGQRIEYFAYLVPFAMGSVLVPMVGQNWGGGRVDRVREAWSTTSRYGALYSVAVWSAFLFAGREVAGLFSDDPRIVRLITHYLWIMLAGSALMHTASYTAFAMNALHRPLSASLLTIIRLGCLVIPLAWIGSRIFGVRGVYSGMTIAHVLTGIVALWWFRGTLDRLEERVTPPLSEENRSRENTAA